MRNALFLTLGLLATATATGATAPASPSGFVELYNAATAAHGAQNWAEMERLLREALAQRPWHPAASYELAAALARQGKKDDAIKQLRALARQGLSFEPEKDPDQDFASLDDEWGYGSVKREFARNRREEGRATTFHKLLDAAFIPVSIAFDEDRRHYFVGSLRQRRIQRILVDGEPMDFARPAYGGLWAPLGMSADSGRRLLWVASAAVPQMENADPAENGKSAVIAYDLDTNERKARYVLKDEGEHRLHGIVALRSGTIYVTDSKAGLLYALNSTSGKFEALTAPGQLASPRGLAINDDKDVLYIADYTQGLFRYDIEKRTLERMAVDPRVCVYGIEGLARHRGDLIAIQNGIRPHRVVRFRLAGSGRRVRGADVLASSLEEFDEPTQGVVVGDRFVFVANSQRGRLTEGNQLPPKDQLRRPLILRIDLAADAERDPDPFRERGVQQQPPPQQGPLLPLPR